ncbi:Hydroxyacid oxidase [Diplonema papillatum]|nr:Hydroxyacid oxidase [Diplonema papillatum]
MEGSRKDVDPMFAQPFTELHQYEAAVEEASKADPKHLGPHYWNWCVDGQEHRKRNRAAYEGVYLRQSCCLPGERELETEIFGQRVHPVGISPVAMHGVAHADAEVATARGASDANAIYCYNYTFATVPMREVVKAKTGGAFWLHMYIRPDTDVVAEKLDEAYETGAFSALVCTCDHPHDRVVDAMLTRFLDYFNGEVPMGNGNAATATNPGPDCTAATWDLFKWYCENSKLPVIAKGIMTVEDAERAVSLGAAGIFVSGHGGRQFAYSPSCLEVLPDIVAAVGAKVNGNIFIDTDIRTGGDVIKAMALGAKACFVGRPAMWGLYLGGADGVRNVVDILIRQLNYNLLCTAVRSVADISPKLIAHLSGPLAERQQRKEMHELKKRTWLLVAACVACFAGGYAVSSCRRQRS